MMEMINFNFIYVSAIFIISDIITGVVSSFITHTFQSSKMREGGLHKLGLVVVIAFAVALDYAQSLVDLGFHIQCTSAICGFLALMEILSCVENINKAFPNALPKALTDILYQTAKDKGVQASNEDGE